MIDEHGNKVLASDVQRILRDTTFKTIMEKVKADQVATFLTSGPHEVQAREEAHALVRALSKIEAAFKSVVDDEAIKTKRHTGRS